MVKAMNWLMREMNGATNLIGELTGGYTPNCVRFLSANKPVRGSDSPYS